MAQRASLSACYPEAKELLDQLVEQQAPLARLSTRREERSTDHHAFTGWLWLKCARASLKIRSWNNTSGMSDDAAADQRWEALQELNEVEEQLTQNVFVSVDASVWAELHRTQSTYWLGCALEDLSGKSGEEFLEKFFSSALKQLSYSDLQSVPADITFQQMQSNGWTQQLGQVGSAALVSDDLRKMDELTQLKTWGLFDAQNLRWIKETLGSVARGSLAGLDTCLNKQAGVIASDQVLKSLTNGVVKVQQKIRLVAFLDLVFASTSAISFAEVKAKTGMDGEQQVERLAMRAMRLGIVRGYIDEVESTIHISWVMPRILDAERTARLKDAYTRWDARLANELDRIQQTLVV